MLGFPPSAVEISSQDQRAERASRTAVSVVVWAMRRASMTVLTNLRYWL